MKIWKKTLALVMALGMTAGFAACGGGGKGDKEPVGEQLQGEGAWAAAWEATLTATNVTIEGSYSYSFYAKENIWSTMDSEGTIELADGKVYTEGSYSQEYDYTGQGQDKGEYSGVTKCYTGMQDGVLYDWFYDEETKEWDQEIAHYDADTFGTAFGLVESNFEVEMDRYDYLAWEALAVYEDGVYTLSYPDEEDTATYKFKFVDGKLYSFDITMTEVEEEGYGYTQTMKQSYVISYGDAKIGKLPYEEGFENEKPEEGGDVGGGTVGGEEIGGGGAVEAPDYSDVKGENVESAEEWNAIYAKCCAETNIFGVQIGTFNDEQSITTLYVQDGKVYMVHVSSGMPGTNYRYVGVVDGVRYSWTSSDNATWSCYEDTDETPLTAAYALSDLAMLPVDALTYDEEKGAMVYSGTANGETGTIEIKVVDGKIVSYSMTAYSIEGEKTSYSSSCSIQYGTATVGELPPVKNGSDSGNVGGGNESIGDGNEDIGGGMATLTQEEWSEIVQLSCNATNLTITVSINSETGVQSVENISIADNKFYSRYSYMGGKEESTRYEYIGEVDGVWYVWESHNWETWSRYLYSDVYEDEIKAVNGSYVFAYYLMLDVATAQYNNKDTGEIVFELSSVEGTTTLHIRVQGGRIIEVRSIETYTDITYMDTEGVFSIEYGNATVGDLPDVSGTDDNAGFENNNDFGGSKDDMTIIG